MTLLAGLFFARHSLTVRADLILDMVHVLTGEARNDVFLVSFSLCGLMLRLVLSQQFFLFVAFLIFKILLYNFSLSPPPIPSPPPDIHVISRNYLLNVLTNLLAAFFFKENLLFSDTIFVSTGRLWDVFDSKLFWRLRIQKVEENLWCTYQPLPISLSVYRPYMKYTAPMCGPVSL